MQTPSLSKDRSERGKPKAVNDCHWHGRLASGLDGLGFSLARTRVQLPIAPTLKRPLRDAGDLPCACDPAEQELVSPARVIEVLTLTGERTVEPQDQVVAAPP